MARLFAPGVYDKGIRYLLIFFYWWQRDLVRCLFGQKWKAELQGSPSLQGGSDSATYTSPMTAYSFAG
jgi:hypothetical protein